MYAKNIWNGITEEKKKNIFDFAEDYKNFLTATKPNRVLLKRSDTTSMFSTRFSPPVPKAD